MCVYIYTHTLKYMYVYRNIYLLTLQSLGKLVILSLVSVFNGISDIHFL